MGVAGFVVPAASWLLDSATGLAFTLLTGPFLLSVLNAAMGGRARDTLWVGVTRAIAMVLVIVFIIPSRNVTEGEGVIPALNIVASIVGLLVAALGFAVGTAVYRLTGAVEPGGS